MFEYLVDRYGGELVFSRMDSGRDELESACGKDFDSLCADWYAENTARCRKLGLIPDSAAFPCFFHARGV